jgi:ABC-2 type transport system permease protein
VLSGAVLMTVGSLVAGIPNPLEPLRMVRVNDPLVPRATFGLLNTLLFFPSGAVYPQAAFPGWMRAIATVDPFSYAVHAFKSLLLKDTGLAAVGPDLLYLTLFSAVTMTLATMLFRRTL